MRLNARDSMTVGVIGLHQLVELRDQRFVCAHVGPGTVGDRLPRAVDELDAAELELERHHQPLGALTVLVAPLASQSYTDSRTLPPRVSVPNAPCS